MWLFCQPQFKELGFSDLVRTLNLWTWARQFLKFDHFSYIVPMQSKSFLYNCEAYNIKKTFASVSRNNNIINPIHVVIWNSSIIGLTRLAVDRVKPWLTKMINSSLSNTLIRIGKLDLGHLIDTLNYLATPTPKSSRFLITFSWIICRTSPCPCSHCPPSKSSGLVG